jgi:hypothetical protein
MITHHLNDIDCARLREANRLLTEITDSHCHSCECELCVARQLTDVQDEDSYHVPDVVPGARNEDN